MNKIGVHALVWVGGWSEAESEQAIAATAACGYDLIEVPLLDPRSVDPEITARQLENHGIGASASLGLSFDTDISSTDPERVARGEALLNDALSVARDMGATYLGGVLFSALNKYPAQATTEGRQNSIGVLARLAEKAKASGITLGLEAVNRYESNLINTGIQAADFIKETGSDNIKVHLDSYHMNIEEGDLAAAIKACGDMLGYFHVGESHRGYLGTGTIDFRTIFRSLADIGYTGTITFESFSSAVVDPNLSNVLAVWRNLWSDGEDLARHAKDFMEVELYAAIKRV
jgi:D-psicose/D-tagatose/L-ribulose 3-epimerase